MYMSQVPGPAAPSHPYGMVWNFRVRGGHRTVEFQGPGRMPPIRPIRSLLWIHSIRAIRAVRSIRSILQAIRLT